MKPFIPNSLPLQNLRWIRFIKLIGQANGELARYDGALQGIINPAVLLSPLTTKEAVLSSRIEGTQATLEEVLEFEATPEQKTDKYKDIQEIINYRKSMRFATEWLNKKPITLNLIKKIHSILLNSVRGKNKARGEFRKKQNWIGKPGCSIEQAEYVPPEPLSLMNHLSNFEKYIHYDELDRLVQLAIIHAQFEIIHPFLDGNGRVGRILIPLFLSEKRILGSPMFYISEYLEANRDEYYDKLENISKKNAWEDWIEFFLKALIKQAKNNNSKVKDIIDLYERKKQRISEITHSQYVIKILDTLFASPIFKTTDFIYFSKIPKASATRCLRLLKKNKIISILRKARGSKPATFTFDKLINLVK